MLIVKCEYGFNELYENSWAGGTATLDTIIENNLEDELMFLLEKEIFLGKVPTETEVNDFLWFEREYIFEYLEITEEEEEEEEEE